MDVYNLVMEIHYSVMYIHNSIRDIQACIMANYNMIAVFFPRLR